MDSTLFFKDKEFNSLFKNKSGLYVIEQELFSTVNGRPVFKIGYARHSLYTRISQYRTAYGLIPFTIHALYCIPEKVQYKRVNYAHLCERIIQETLKENGRWTKEGEWFYDMDMIMNCLFALRKKNSKIRNADDWVFWDVYDGKAKRIKLVDDETIKSKYSDLFVGRGVRTRTSEEEDE